MPTRQNLKNARLVPMRCLLDKVVARYTLSGFLKLAEGTGVNREELFSLDLFARAFPPTLQLFITPASAQVLQRLMELPRYTLIARRFQERVKIVFPARYYTRWMRRLREYNFSKEDAAILALASFGTDEMNTILGMHFVATYDQPLLNNWVVQQNTIQAHLAAMQHDIPRPYCETQLPKVLLPEQIV